MSRLISRDPFAREEVRREAVTATLQGCRWCGGTSGQRNLYRYHVESDGGRRSTVPGLFCSISCMRSYHG